MPKNTWRVAMKARITWTKASTGMTAERGYGKQWPPPNPAMARNYWRKKKEVLYFHRDLCIYMYIYISMRVHVRERALAAPPHDIAAEADFAERVKWEKQKWICCDFVITMGTMVPARIVVWRKKNVSFFIFFPFRFFYFIYDYLWYLWWWRIDLIMIIIRSWILINPRFL